jgi:GNAT superfamily N-acetyltransferase
MDLAYQVHPGHAALADEVISWYDDVAAGLERTALPGDRDELALERWTAHGYQADPASLGDTGSWTQFNRRDLVDLEHPVLPDGYRFLTGGEAGPEAAVRAHIDAWAPSSYSAEAYEGVRRTATYRGDLHVLVQAADGTMAASTIMWLDEANRTAEFEPVGTHPGYRCLGLGTAMLWHGMRRARAAGATHMTVACAGAPGRPGARGLYYGVGFRPISRDMPQIKPAVSAGTPWTTPPGGTSVIPATAHPRGEARRREEAAEPPAYRRDLRLHPLHDRDDRGRSAGDQSRKDCRQTGL